jgi:DNA-binding transcriptional ArsR family regulator
MIRFRLSVEALGRTTFGYSPMAEVAASLRLLWEPKHGYVMQPWLRDVQPILGRLDLNLLKMVVPPGPWAPDFLFAWSPDPRITIQQQLEEVEQMPTEQLRADLESCWRQRQMPAALERMLDDEPGSAAPARLVADAIWDYWRTAIAPYWTRIRAVLDDDVSYRGSRALTSGIFMLFDDLHPEVTLSDQVLQVDKPHHGDVTYDGSRITLIPSVFAWPNLMIGHETANQFSLTYAARGVARVWEGLPDPDDSAGDLGALVGRTRASILRRLEIPMTTTHLARELGASPGTISQHLSVLRRSGMLDSWRSGRSVLYRRTPLATSLLAAADRSSTRTDFGAPGA